MKITPTTATALSDALYAASRAVEDNKVSYDVVWMEKSRTYIHMPTKPSATEFGWEVFATIHV